MDFCLVSIMGFTINLDSPGFDVMVDFYYHVKSPLSVTVTFTDPENPSTSEKWVFARDLLIAGIEGEAGELDVKVRGVDKDFVSITLYPDEVPFEAFLERKQVQAFIDITQMLVPQSEEKIYVPDTVAELFKISN